jgi:hypothetical protein
LGSVTDLCRDGGKEDDPRQQPLAVKSTQRLRHGHPRDTFARAWSSAAAAFRSEASRNSKDSDFRTAGIGRKPDVRGALANRQVGAGFRMPADRDLALYFAPGADWSRSVISSTPSTDASRSGSRTAVSRWARSGRSSVTVKKKRRAETELREVESAPSLAMTSGDGLELRHPAADTPFESRLVMEYPNPIFRGQIVAPGERRLPLEVAQRFLSGRQAPVSPGPRPCAV